MLIDHQPPIPEQIAKSLAWRSAPDLKHQEPVPCGDLNIIVREMNERLNECQYLSVVVVQHGGREPQC